MEEILITQPKLPVTVKCPKCDDIFVTGAAKINVYCRNCKKDFTAEAKPSVITIYSARIQQKISNINELRIKAKPFFQKEIHIFHEMFKKQKCWDLSEVEMIDSYDERRYCNNCGYCNSCKVCVQCEKHMKTEAKKCLCGSKTFERTYLQNIKDNKCPECGKDNILYTVIEGKTKCPKCKTDNITPKKKIKVYSFIIKRKRAFTIAEG